MSDGTVIAPEAGARYTANFQMNRRVFIVAACNYGLARYRWEEDSLTRFRLFAATPRTCGDGSQSQAFLQNLAQVSDAMINGGDLYLLLAGDSGSMHFTRR
jgi:heat shock protein HslJ